MYFRRINPFDQAKTSMVTGNGSNSAFHEVFEVRFCGSMQVQTDRGQYVSDSKQRCLFRRLHAIWLNIR